MPRAKGAIEVNVGFRPEDGPIYDMVSGAKAKARLINRLAALGALIERGNLAPPSVAHAANAWPTEAEQPKETRTIPRMAGDDSGCEP